ncbi:MAG: DUF5667 domain-containing protein [bacterium]
MSKQRPIRNNDFTDGQFEALLTMARPGVASPRLDFKENLRSNLRSIYAKKVSEQRSVSSSEQYSLVERFRHAVMMRFPRWVLAPFVFMLFASSLTTYAYTNSSVTNKSSLFILKQTIESVQLSLAFSQQKKVETYLAFSERRLQEARFLASQGELDPSTLIEINENLNQSLQVLQQVKDPQEQQKLIALVTSTSSQNLTGLREIASQVVEHNDEYSSLDQPNTTSASVSPEVASLAQVMNNVTNTTSSDFIQEKIDSSSSPTAFSELHHINISSVPPQILGTKGSSTIVAALFDQAGNDVTKRNDIVYSWKILSGAGNLQQIQPNQVFYTTSEIPSDSKTAVIEVIASSNGNSVSNKVSILFVHPIETVDIVTTFGSALSLSGFTNAQLSAKVGVKSEFSDIGQRLVYKWTVLDGKVLLLNPSAQSTTIQPQQLGNATVQLDVFYGDDVISRQFTFTVLSDGETVTITPDISSSPTVPLPQETKVKTPYPVLSTTPEASDKKYYVRMTSSSQALTGGQTAQVKFVVSDENWVLYPDELVKAILTGIGSLSGVNSNGDGTYTAIYTAPATIAHQTTVTISATISNRFQPVQSSLVLTLYPKNMGITAGSVSGKPGDIVAIPLTFLVPKYVSLQTCDFVVRLPYNTRFVSGGELVGNNVHYNCSSEGAAMLRVQINESVQATSLRIIILNATAVDATGETIGVKLTSGVIEIKGLTPTPAPVYTKIPANKSL